VAAGGPVISRKEQRLKAGVRHPPKEAQNCAELLEEE
jgi:hypothetical protein